MALTANWDFCQNPSTILFGECLKSRNDGLNGEVYFKKTENSLDDISGAENSSLVMVGNSTGTQNRWIAAWFCGPCGLAEYVSICVDGFFN